MDQMKSFASSLKQRLLRGALTCSYGPLLMMDSPILAELMSSTGYYDHIIVDHEHSPTSIRSGQAMLQAIRAGNANVMMRQQKGGQDNKITEPIVRVPSPNDPIYMKKVLDSLKLPGGVLIPMVEDVDTALDVIKSTRYPKQIQRDDDDSSSSCIDGVRGCAAPFVRGSSYGHYSSNPEDYFQQCQDDLLVLIQIETVKGVDAIPDIIDACCSSSDIDGNTNNNESGGIDGIFIGPFDLSCSIGLAGQFDHPDVIQLIQDAEEAVLEASNRNNKNCLLTGFKPPNRSVQDMINRSGYKLICGAVDIGMMNQSAKLDIISFENALISPPPPPPPPPNDSD